LQELFICDVRIKNIAYSEVFLHEIYRKKQIVKEALAVFVENRIYLKFQGVDTILSTYIICHIFCNKTPLPWGDEYRRIHISRLIVGMIPLVRITKIRCFSQIKRFRDFGLISESLFVAVYVSTGIDTVKFVGSNDGLKCQYPIGDIRF